ncbi:MAG: Periplasmic thiol disulfide interchange protein DsbA [Myxococcaceae bacterium]|nr:Periplasmic thiol disulfide interchange protein DsbA [Myxococcaceae bacterium]
MSKGAAAICVLLALVTGLLAARVTGVRAPAGPAAAEASTSPSGPAMLDAARIPVGTSPVLGSSNALVTIVMFGDFQCPFCARVEDTLRQVRQHYGNEVRVVWKNGPLPFHSNAGPAAEAAMEAFAQGGHARFWQMHALLYQNQQNLDIATLERLAGQVGLNMARFRTAMSSHTHVASIERDKALAQAVGAQGTPNFFINGTQVTGAQPLDQFKIVIDQVLARARTIRPRQRVYAEMVADPFHEPEPYDAHRELPYDIHRGCGEVDPTQVLRVPVGGSPVEGPSTALVTMVIFADFQCPFCVRVRATIAQLRTRYGDDLRVVWKNEPQPFHDRARPAAELAMDAFTQRGNAGFWEMRDLLLGHEQSLESADLDAHVRRAHLDVAGYHAAIAAHAHDAAINADHALARRLEAICTPHFFINGRRLVGAQPEEAFVRLIDEVKTRAEEFLQTHPGTTRANLYERLMADADPAVRRNTPAASPPPPDEESRVYAVRDDLRAPSFGPTDARVVIQQFADYQCPFCARVGPQVARIRERYGDRVRFVWHDYPLPFHREAMLAAEAAREAYAQRGNPGFWRFHDRLFENQGHLERADLERYATELGLDTARFRDALDRHTHQAGIRADMAAADATGAQMGPPAFFINGRFVVGALPFEEFRRRIDAALAPGASPQADRRPRPAPR